MKKGRWDTIGCRPSNVRLCQRCCIADRTQAGIAVGKLITGADPAASGCVRVGALKIADMLSRILELIWFSLAPAGVDAWDAKPKPLTTRLNMS